MIRIVLLLQPGEAKALRAMCRRFTFDDALHHLRGVPNIAPDALCEASTACGKPWRLPAIQHDSVNGLSAPQWMANFARPHAAELTRSGGHNSRGQNS
jgi:hypothetical protein